MRQRETRSKRLEKSKGPKNQLAYKRTEIEKERSFDSGKFFNYLILATIVGLVYLAFFSGAFSVATVNVLGTKDINPDAVKSLVNNRLEKQLFKNNIFLFDTDMVSYEIKKEHSLKKLKIRKKYPNSIEVELNEYSSQMQWVSKNKYYLIDEKGRVVGEFSESKKDLPTVYDKKDIGVVVGKSLVTGDFINFIKYLNQNFSEKTGAKITKIEVNESFNEVSVYTSLGFYIIFDTTRNPESEIKNVFTALQSKEIKGKKMTYMDMRIKNKVFYK